MTIEPSEQRPYKGPSPFDETDAYKFFGRSADLEMLRGLLRTERIVVLHSPSGAGKTSLVQAGLVPRMRKDEFKVVSPIRVHLPPPEQSTPSDVMNRYSYSVIRSIETVLAKDLDRAPTESADEGFCDIPLSTYFAHRSALRAGGESLLLVFDQFEEVFTILPRERHLKLQFFSELGAVLQDKTIWALFAIKEEYVGALDSYSRLVPTHFGGRYHLDFLTLSGAEEAVSKPLECHRIPFDQAAVRKILMDLSCADGEAGGVMVRQDTKPDEIPAIEEQTFIDPLHLQLVCEHVWSEVRNKEVTTLTIDDVKEKILGDHRLSAVDAALMQYYDKVIDEGARAYSFPERDIREWIEQELIEGGVRRRPAMASDAESSRGGMERFLEKRHILRPGFRAGSEWYELAHDRLVLPVCRSNDLWCSKNLSIFEQNARQWFKRNKPQDFGAIPLREWGKYGFRDLIRHLFSSPAGGGRGSHYSYENEYLAFCRKNAQRTVVVAFLLPLIAIFVWTYANWEAANRAADIAANIAKLNEQVVTSQSQKDVLDTALKESKRELEKSRSEIKQERLRGLLRRLQGLAMLQRYVYQNHDTTLLLGHLALAILELEGDHEDKANGSTATVELELKRSIWAALEASPLSKTLPAESLGGQPRRLVHHGPGARVLVKGDQESNRWRVASIDLAEDKLQIQNACSDSLQHYSPDGQYFIAVGKKSMRVMRASTCEEVQAVSPLGNKDFEQAKAPVYSPDGKYLAVFLVDGQVSVYRRADSGQYAPVGEIETVEKVKGEKSGKTYPITAVAFVRSTLAVGDTGGTVRVFEMSGGDPILRQSFPGNESDWPFFGLAKYEKRYGEILALSMTDEDPPWLTTVHVGGLHISGGFVLRRRIAPGEPPYLLWPDRVSSLREQIARESRSLPDNPSGEKHLSASFEPDGRWLVTGGEQGTVVLWDLTAPEDLVDLGSNQEIIRRQLVPRRILLGMVGGAHEVLSTGVERRHEGEPLSGIKKRTVLGIDSVAGLRMWDIAVRTESYTAREYAREDYVDSFPQPTPPYSYALGFLTENQILTTTNTGRVKVWRLERVPLRVDQTEYDKKLVEIPGIPISTSIRALDISGNYVALAMGDQTAKVIDLRRPSFELRLTGPDGTPLHRDGLWSVAFTPKNPQLSSRHDLATGDYSGKLIFWDLESANSGQGLTHRVTATCEFREGQETMVSQGRTTNVAGLAFHPNGRWLLVGTEIDPPLPKRHGQLHLLDMEGKNCLETSQTSAVKCSNASNDPVSPPPCLVWTIDSIDEVNDGVAGEENHGEADNNRLSMPPVHSVAFSTDGSRFAASGDYGMVWWWEFGERESPVAPKKGTVLEGVKGKVNAVKFFPEDKKRLAAAGQDGFLRLWTLLADPCLKANPLTLRQAGTELLSLAISSDGQLIAAGSARGLFHLWDLDTSRYVCQLVLRNLTWREWSSMVGRALDIDGRKSYWQVCPDHPLPPDLPDVGVEVRQCASTAIRKENP